MPSPFPGMDPYLEAPAYWQDFHLALAPEMQAQLNPKLGLRYYAELGAYRAFEEVGISSNGADGSSGKQRFEPDVSIVTGSVRRPVGGALPVPTSPPPVLSAIPMPVERRILRVEIREVRAGGLVTAIEILSPWNKQPGARAHGDYLRKREILLQSWVHLIEVDLLRGGLRPPLARPVPDAPYYVGLSRSERRPIVEVWPIPLWAPLPVVPVPLLEPDPDVPLDLQAAVDSVYSRAAYDRRVDYRGRVPPPPLTLEEAEWVARLLAQADGRRGTDD